MKTQSLAQNLNKNIQWRNRLLIALAALFILNVIQGVSVFSLIGRQKTIVVPATFDREFTVSSKFSDSYLEQMAQYFAGLLLNITPATCVVNAEQLLKHVASENYATVKEQLVEQNREIEKRGISTVFYLSHLRVNSKDLWVELKGDLKILIANAPMESKSRTYKFQFAHRNGLLKIKTFSEVQNDV